MVFTPEQLKRMNDAKTAEELIELARAEGIKASEKEIRAQFYTMHKEGELEDDELDNVAGGCGGEDSYVPNVGDWVVYKPNGQEGVVGKKDNYHFSHSKIGVTNASEIEIFEAGYEVELKNGSIVWAKEDELSPFTTGAAISF